MIRHVDGGRDTPVTKSEKIKLWLVYHIVSGILIRDVDGGRGTPVTSKKPESGDEAVSCVDFH